MDRSVRWSVDPVRWTGPRTGGQCFRVTRSCYPGHVEVVSLKECTRHISRHLQLHGLSADKAVDSEFKCC